MKLPEKWQKVVEQNGEYVVLGEHGVLGENESVGFSAVFDSLQSHGLQLTRLLCPQNSPGKNTGVGSHSLLQGIFPTQGSNPGLQHCRQILYHLSHQESHTTTKKKRVTLIIVSLYYNQMWKIFLYLHFTHAETGPRTSNSPVLPKPGFLAQESLAQICKVSFASKPL